VQDHILSTSGDALTLPNFIERNHPKKGGNKKQGTRTKVQASKQTTF